MMRALPSALVLIPLVIGTPTVFGVPINVESSFSFRETRFNAPANFTQGDIFQVGISLAETSVLPDAPVTITNSNTGEVFVATEGVNSTTGRPTFYSNIQYSESRALGDWQFAASNDGDQLTVSRPAFGLGPGTGPLPGVENLTVSGLSAAPVLSWELPDDLASLNDGNVDRLRVRVQDDEGTVFDSRADMGLSLSLEETSFQVPFGYLEDEGTYYAQVLIEGFQPFNRSRTYSTFELVDNDVERPAYQITQIPVHGFSVSVNNSGQVVGTDAEGTEFIYSPDGDLNSLRDLYFPTSEQRLHNSTIVNNNLGNFAGNTPSVDGVIGCPHGGSCSYFADEAGLRAIESPRDGEFSFSVTDLNDANQIVGSDWDGVSERAFILNPDGTVVDLGNLGGDFAYARGINQIGQVVGTSQTALGDYSGFFWDPSVGMLDIGSLGGGGTNPLAVNEAGVVVGFSSPVNNTQQPFIWDSVSGIRELGTLRGAGGGFATGISRDGVVVGHMREGVADRESSGFYWSPDTGMLDIEYLIDDLTGWEYLVQVDAISDSGEFMAGWGVTSEGENRVFLLQRIEESTAVPEPTTTALLALGLFGAGFGFRRRRVSSSL